MVDYIKWKINTITFFPQSSIVLMTMTATTRDFVQMEHAFVNQAGQAIPIVQVTWSDRKCTTNRVHFTQVKNVSCLLLSIFQKSSYVEWEMPPWLVWQGLQLDSPVIFFCLLMTFSNQVTKKIIIADRKNNWSNNDVFCLKW